MQEIGVRERIVGAATEQMSQGRVSVDRVATAAGVSRATVYRYFPDKASLLREAAGEPTATDPRAQILEAALAIFLEHGIHRATLKQVADRAGLSLSGLHWHFKNKDELVGGIAEHLELLPVVGSEVAAAGTADLETQLTHIGGVVMATFRAKPGLLRLALCEASVYPDVARIATRHMIGRGLPLLSSLFEQHAQRGTLRPGPSRVRAQAFISMFIMLVLLRPIVGNLIDASDEECAREYVQILLHGITATPEGAV